MKTKLKNQSGFTLIEIMIVVVIVGIMAAFAIPMSQNLSAKAHLSVAKSIAGAVRNSLDLYGANQLALTGVTTYPASLGVNFANVFTADARPTPGMFTLPAGEMSFGHNDSNAYTSQIANWTYAVTTVDGANQTYTLTCAGAGCAL